MSNSAESYIVLGLMSGTSLDGLDIAAVHFERMGGRWSYHMIAADCIGYSEAWREQLKNAPKLPKDRRNEVHARYGAWLGQEVLNFSAAHGLNGRVDLVGSHGHTVLHDPANGVTFQLGDGAALSAVAGLPVVSDLRSLDVSLGGQGAPIVPAAEHHLFPESRLFLNIGGIANISCHGPDSITAYDIGPGNTPLNILARTAGMEYDEDGRLARSGTPDSGLSEKLRRFGFYSEPIPRSLHTDRIVSEFMAMIEKSDLSTADKLCTVTGHIAAVTGEHIASLSARLGGADHVIATGGGAFNGFLMERLAAHAPIAIRIPDALTVAYKEAVAMAFLALLRSRGEVNVYASVTGASRDSSSGACHGFQR